MASQAHPVTAARYDVRTVVGGGIILGVITAIGVVGFTFLSRGSVAGTVETAAQVALVLVGGAIAAYFPAHRVRPHDVDTIGWAALVGLLGALTFTVIDTVIFRTIHLYPWTWDALGGGSGFWYVPVWWMGATVLAWLGAWVYANGAAAGQAVVRAAVMSLVLALILWVVLGSTGVGPFNAAMAGLSFGLALAMHVAVSVVLARR